MAKRITVTEAAIRQVVNEALDGGHLGDLTMPEEEQPVKVNPVVDPSASQTDPSNPDFVPQTTTELDIAVHDMLKGLGEDEVVPAFKSIQAALLAVKEKTEKGEEMTKAAQGGTVNVEETVRRQVRKLLSEISPKFDTAYSGTDYSDSDADDDDEDDKKPKRAYKSTAIGNMNDVGGSSFEQIATELGFAVSGAKQAVDKALDKARFIATIDDDDKEILVLNAMNDYIKMLAKSGELSSSEVQLMKDHPEIVRELDGFREFLHNVFRRARKSDQKVADPLGESTARKTSFVMSEAMDSMPTKKCRFCSSGVKTFLAPGSGIEYLDKHAGPDGHDCVGSRSKVSAAVTEAAKKKKKSKYGTATTNHRGETEVKPGSVSKKTDKNKKR